MLLAAVVSFFMAWFGFVAIFASNNGFDGPSALGSTLTVVTCVGTGVVALVCVLRLWTSRVGDLGRAFATIPFVLVIVAAIWFLVSAFGGEQGHDFGLAGPDGAWLALVLTCFNLALAGGFVAGLGAIERHADRRSQTLLAPHSAVESAPLAPSSSAVPHAGNPVLRGVGQVHELPTWFGWSSAVAAVVIAIALALVNRYVALSTVSGSGSAGASGQRVVIGLIATALLLVSAIGCVLALRGHPLGFGTRAVAFFAYGLAAFGLNMGLLSEIVAFVALPTAGVGTADPATTRRCFRRCCRSSCRGSCEVVLAPTSRSFTPADSRRAQPSPQWRRSVATERSVPAS
ncbi:hypothetical protein AA983_00595 [Dermacoccus sp. PE3]|nr:hypothetical protein AA983_00595 [Dermacoccus sp. PE3]